MKKETYTFTIPKKDNKQNTEVDYKKLSKADTITLQEENGKARSYKVLSFKETDEDLIIEVEVPTAN